MGVDTSDVIGPRKGAFFVLHAVSPTNTDFEEFFHQLLDTPLRTIVAVTPVKKIMYNAGKANRHMAGTISEEELGERLESDAVRMNKLRKEKGLDPA